MARHDQLWAPWRLDYVSGAAAAEAAKAEAAKAATLAFLPGADRGCFLCRAAVDTDERANRVIERTELALVMLNRFPYNNGHLLVAPLGHLGRLDELTDTQRLDLQCLLDKYVRRYEQLLKAEGFNIGLNLGRVAGAGLPGHLHWHLVPRWAGDTNFMPSVAGLRVIPQSLDALWELLHDAARSDG